MGVSAKGCHQQTNRLLDNSNGGVHAQVQAPVEEEEEPEERDVASTSSSGRPKVPRTVGDGRFKIGKKLGSGSYSEVHSGVDMKTGEKVAAKFEWTRAEKTGKLLAEAKLCQIFRSPSIPRVRWVGSEGEYNIMVMDVCGPSLEDLMDQCGGQLSVRTVLRLGIQMVDLLEYVHSHNILHRDIKPNNFLIGVGENENRVYIVDFGLAKRYRCPVTGEHIPCSKKKGLTGTVRYTSLNVHRGLEPARRDDLGAVGYVLMYLMRGRLPWQGISAKSKRTKQRKIGRRKEKVRHVDLCNGFPLELVQYLHYCDELGYQDEPDYNYLKGLLTQALALHDARYAQSPFDWVIPAPVVNSKRQRSPEAIHLAEALAPSESAKRRRLDGHCAPACAGSSFLTPEANVSKTAAADLYDRHGRRRDGPPDLVQRGDPQDILPSEEYQSYEYESEQYEYEEEEEEEEELADDVDDLEEEESSPRMLGLQRRELSRDLRG